MVDKPVARMEGACYRNNEVASSTHVTNSFLSNGIC